jgi:ABC-2 type transport system permease protein
MSSLARAAFQAFWISMRLRFVSSFAILGWLLFPTIFAAVGLFVLVRPGVSPSQLAYAVLGGGLLGYWGVAYLDGGLSIQNERWSGTLEHIFAVPTPLWVILLGKVCGSVVWGMLSFLPTLALAYFGFHAVLPAIDAGPFAISFVVLTFSFLVVAFAFAPLFALWRWALPVLNGFELGFYTFCGFMFPIAILPGWAQPLSAVLAPAWATRAIYASTTLSGPHDYAVWWLESVGLSLAYLAGAVFLYRLVDDRARKSGELALA